MSDREPPPRRPRTLTITVTGPEAMLEAMANLLRSEGYTVEPPPAPAAPALLVRQESARARKKRGRK